MGLFGKKRETKAMQARRLQEEAARAETQKAEQEAATVLLKGKLDECLRSCRDILKGEPVQALCVVVQAGNVPFAAPAGNARQLCHALKAADEWVRERSLDAANFSIAEAPAEEEETQPSQPPQEPQEPPPGEGSSQEAAPKLEAVPSQQGTAGSKGAS
jgi:hypothetical protein